MGACAIEKIRSLFNKLEFCGSLIFTCILMENGKCSIHLVGTVGSCWITKQKNMSILAVPSRLTISVYNPSWCFFFTLEKLLGVRLRSYFFYCYTTFITCIFLFLLFSRSTVFLFLSRSTMKSLNSLRKSSCISARID